MNLSGFGAHGCAYKTGPASARQKAFLDTLCASKEYLGRVHQKPLAPTNQMAHQTIPQKPESSKAIFPEISKPASDKNNNKQTCLFFNHSTTFENKPKHRKDEKRWG